MTKIILRGRAAVDLYIEALKLKLQTQDERHTPEDQLSSWAGEVVTLTSLPTSQEQNRDFETPAE